MEGFRKGPEGGQSDQPTHCKGGFKDYSTSEFTAGSGSCLHCFLLCAELALLVLWDGRKLCAGVALVLSPLRQAQCPVSDASQPEA